jgi:hypothetical protein
MSQFQTLEGASAAFQSMVWEALRGAKDASGAAILQDVSQVTLAAPYEITSAQRPTKNFFSVFLYRVQPNTNVAVPPPRIGAPQVAPLALDLFYLLTPLTNEPENDQKLLGLALKRLHDVPILIDSGTGIGAPLQPVTGTIRIVQVSPPPEQLSYLWSAFRQPLHLAATFSLGPILLN